MTDHDRHAGSTRVPAAPHVGGRMLVGLGLTAGAILAAQIVLSRLFGATVGYYYAFMLISMAMLGLGCGALLVHQFPRFYPAERLETQAWALSIAAGVSSTAGTVIMLMIYPGVSSSYSFFFLTGVFLCFFPFFLFAGTVVSLVLIHARQHFARAYSADLVGAGAACLAAVLLLNIASPVLTALHVVSVMPIAAACFFAHGPRRSKRLVVAVGVAFGLIAIGRLVAGNSELASPRNTNWLMRPRLITEWNGFSNVSVFPEAFFTWGLSDRYSGPRFPMHSLMIDGIGGTQIVRFDGRPESLKRYEYLDYDLTSLGQELVDPSGRQLIIGPGGGVDILQSYRRGRRDVWAVEINSLVARVVNDIDGSFSGGPYRLPGVRVVIDNGRTFLRRSADRWDLISLTWVDTGGSSTALAASENYLYTVEAIQDYMAHLVPNGSLAFMRALGTGNDFRLDTLRGIAVTIEALVREGIRRPGDHLIVAGVQSRYFFRRGMCYVLVKKSPFTPAELEQIGRSASRLGFEVLWRPDRPPNPDSMRIPFARVTRAIEGILTAPDRSKFYEQASIDIVPTTDDNPFYFVERAGPNRPAGYGVRSLWKCCLLLLVLTLLFLGIPMLPQTSNTEAVGVRGAAFLAYTACLGIGFLMTEIEFFHVFALVLGNPMYALATVLASLLVFSGLGSLTAERIARSRVLALPFLLLLLLLGGFLLAKDAILSALIIQPFGVRLAGTVLLVAPLAFAMGIPMAAGMTLMSDRKDLMMWGWALNGACSVLTSVAAILLAIHIGIKRTFLIGMVCYFAAGILAQVLRGVAPRE